MSLTRQLLSHHPSAAHLEAVIFSLASIHPPPAALPRSLLPRPISTLASPAIRRQPNTADYPPRRAFSSKRPLVTAAAAKHDTTEKLDHVAPPPPPRNAVASAVPGVNDVRPPEGAQERSSVQSRTQSGPEKQVWAASSLPGKEQETATSTPRPIAQPGSETREASTATSASADATIEKMSRPKSKLRPLRAAVKLTPAAVAHIRALLDQPEPKLLRIGTQRRGCSGLAYHLEYVDKADKLDEVVCQDGVEVLVEGRALLNVLGSTMDWVDEKLGSRFVFTNPNIKEQCGCGESFMV